MKENMCSKLNSDYTIQLFCWEQRNVALFHISLRKQFRCSGWWFYSHLQIIYLPLYWTINYLYEWGRVEEFPYSWWCHAAIISTFLPNILTCTASWKSWHQKSGSSPKSDIVITWRWGNIFFSAKKWCSGRAFNFYVIGVVGAKVMSSIPQVAEKSFQSHLCSNIKSRVGYFIFLLSL